LPAGTRAVPPGSPNPTQDGAGPAEVVVTTTSGLTSGVTAAARFEYVDETTGPTVVPSVTGISPYGGLDSDPAGPPGAVTVFGSGFVGGSTSVAFGAHFGASVNVITPYELTVVPPPFNSGTTPSYCPVDNGTTGPSAFTDICQVNVTAIVGGHDSAISTILKPYEAASFNFDSMGALVLPAGCNCEDEPQPSEFDYVPAPTITSVSTGTLADLPDNADVLASEFGSALTNTITVTGTGMDPLTLSYLTLGPDQGTSDSIIFPIGATGTSVTFDAPAIGLVGPSVEPEALPIGVTSIAGVSNSNLSVVYAGIPEVSTVVDTATGLPYVPAVTSCVSPPPSGGCGVPISLAGAGFDQAVGPVAFDDAFSGTSLGLQNTYTVNSDTSISTTSLQQNPGEIDVLVCSNTACGFPLGGTQMIIYPPGDPSISGLSATAGPAHGGNEITISGSNLGCVVSVSFGSTVALSQSNEQAFLDCGQTGSVIVTVPPGAANSSVPVSIVTIESVATGSHSNTVNYTYQPSTPSQPLDLSVVPGGGDATVNWATPATDGGQPIADYSVVATSPGRATVAATVAASGRSYFFRYLQPGVPWTVTVQAVSALGPGLPATDPDITLGLGDNGYLAATANGAVFGFGSLASSGGVGGGHISGTVVGIAATPNALGYWEATSTGAVYHFGDAGSYGQP
ncbi:MAG TPA: fibronectin type III domain-containing protein, partial [Acidimicrobiales bacterium]|nr:fibronectin type III domain-containing protein [Acidimicrobiales bacterium]